MNDLDFDKRISRKEVWSLIGLIVIAIGVMIFVFLNIDVQEVKDNIKVAVKTEEYLPIFYVKRAILGKEEGEPIINIYGTSTEYQLNASTVGEDKFIGYWKPDDLSLPPAAVEFEELISPKENKEALSNLIFGDEKIVGLYLLDDKSLFFVKPEGVYRLNIDSASSSLVYKFPTVVELDENIPGSFQSAIPSIVTVKDNLIALTDNSVIFLDSGKRLTILSPDGFDLYILDKNDRRETKINP